MARRQKKEIARLRRLLRSRNRTITDLKIQVDGLQAQVSHAAKAAGEMAAHSRAAEVALHAANLSRQGINVFGGPRNRVVGIEIPAISAATHKLLGATPEKNKP